MAKKRFNRVYHHFSKWEEVDHGMWSTVSNKSEHLDKAIELTGNHEKYGSYMLMVIEQWPISCENALTDEYLNRRAWIGHAACALAINCPQDIVRKAWSYLTDEQRLLANKKADEAITLWEESYIKNKCIRENVDGQMLFQWPS